MEGYQALPERFWLIHGPTGWTIEGPFVSAEQLAGAVDALEQIKAELARIGSAAEREDGASLAFVIACESLDELRGR